VGGTVVIQDEASCVVFGMPGAVLAAGLQDRIAPPDEIAAIIMDKAGGLAPVRQGGGHG
jgi:two-component system chemotaxis response regulator CheB